MLIDSMKVVFIPVKYEKSLEQSAKQALKQVLSKYSKIGIVTISPFYSSVNLVKEFLEKQLGKEVFISSGKRLEKEAEILGCDVGAAVNIAPKVTAFLYIGDGHFHPFEVYIKTKKPVIVYTPVENAVYEIDYEEAQKLEKKRLTNLGRVLSSDSVGILVSTKIGQLNLKKADELKKILESKGKKVFVFVFDTLTQDIINDFNVESFINTACPRIIDDYYSKPLANADDVLKELKKT